MFDLLALLITHGVSALIQSNALLASTWLEDSATRAGLPTSVWSAAALAWLGWSLFRAVGTSRERSLWQDFFLRLGPIWESRGWLIVAALLVPQRFMDSNSGYTTIDPEHPLASVLLFLDGSRMLLSLALLRWLLTSFQQAPVPWPKILPQRVSQTFFPIFIGGALCLVLQFGVLGNIPRVQDEIIQHWQARLYAQGTLHTDPFPVLEPFVPDPSVGGSPNGLYSAYQPAFALLTSVLVNTGTEGVINPLLVIFCGVLFFRLVKETHGTPFAQTALLILSISPFLILMGASRMNHLLGLFCFLGFSVGWVAAAKGRTAAGILLSGLCLGTLLLTRRIEAVALLAGASLSVFILPQSYWRRGFYLAGTWTFFIGAFFGQKLWSAWTSGDSLLMVRHLQVVAGHFAGLQPGLLWQNLLDNVCGLSFWAFGGLLPAWAGLVRLWPVQARVPSPEARALDQFLVIHACLLIAMYSGYYFQDFCYGPRFYFPLLPALAIGWARLFQDLRECRFPSPIRSLWAPAAALALFIIGQQAWASLGNDFWHIRPDLPSFIKTQAPPSSLIFLQHPARPRLQLLRILHQQGLPQPLLAQAISADAADYEGILATLPASSTAGMISVVENALQAARYQRPEWYAINSMEVLRLNRPSPWQGSVVLAMDLGDTLNEHLIQALPGLRPYLALRRGSSYELHPYSRAGIPRFDEPQSPAGSENLAPAGP